MAILNVMAEELKKLSPADSWKDFNNLVSSNDLGYKKMVLK